MTWTLYILRCADETFYTGITTDLKRRLIEHNTSNKGAKYTRARRPVQCIFMQDFSDRSSVSRAEHIVKKLSREQKHALISGDFVIE